MTLRSLLRRLLPGAAGSPRRRSAPPPPRNILVLGGSNTLMKNGYLPALLAGLESRFGQNVQMTNLAVGANSSVHGLMLAKGVPDLAAFDLVIVEYGVNDVKYASRGAISVWQGATEGLLRCLVAVRPARPVVFLNILRRDMKPEQFRPTRHLKRLVDHYAKAAPVFLVDVDDMLRNRIFPAPGTFRSLYSDQGHFRRPQVAGLVGAYVSSEIARHLGRRRKGRDLPRPLAAWHFADAELLDLSDGPGVRRLFSNSRFRLETRALAIGESLTLDLPGELACIEFVSDATAASLRVSEEGCAPFAIHTRHPRVDRFPFLLLSHPLARKPWPTLRGRGPRRLTLEAVAEVAAEELAGKRMTPPDPERAEAVYLRRLLCLDLPRG